MSSTKTVSFRLPMDEYIKYLQKATSMNLGPADYALLKIYSEEKEQKELEELKWSNSQLNASKSEIEAEYEDFKTEVRENYAKEVAKATDDLKAKYEAELKAKEAETKKLVSQKDELAKKLREIETAKETANNEIMELQEISEKSKQEIQAIKAEAAKQIQSKDAVIQNLESKLETAKQENKQLVADTKSKLQKVQTDAEQKMKIMQADWIAKYNANIETLVKEIDKNNVPTSKSFREKWIKRGKEL